MSRTVFSTILLSMLSGTTSAQNALSPEALQRIKAATVFVQVESGRLRSSGSGFLVRVDGKTGYLVTNDHVVHQDGVTEEMAAQSKVRVVFDSGNATERTVSATIAAADPERDLAVLKIEKVDDLPTPLDIDASPKLFETMPVFVCGFPFGDSLVDGKKNPEISIGSATISSIRTEVAGGPVSTVQLNGALNPGNSGGPVVTADGKLVGVAVKTLRGAGIGLAIPQHEVASMLRGRPGRILLLPVEKSEPTKDEIPAKLEVTLIDPLAKIQSVTAYTQTGKNPMSPTMMTPGPLPGFKKMPMTIQGSVATLDVTLPPENPKSLTVQLELELKEGKLYTNAIVVPVGPRAPGEIGRRPGSDPNGPQKTPEGKLKLASGKVLPFPSVPAPFPTASNSESVSLVNASPGMYLGKTIQLDAISPLIVNPTNKGEFELVVETDSENPPSDLRVVLPKDLALQISELGIPELLTAAIQIKYPVRLNGTLAKPSGRERRYTFAAERIDILDEDSKPTISFKSETNPPSGPPTLSSLNRFPHKYVGQTVVVEGLVKGTRYAGGTSIDIADANQVSPLNLEVYTSRSLAGQVDSDIAKIDLPARARMTLEVKAINGRTEKGVVGVREIELLSDTDQSIKVLKTSSTVEYPTIPSAPKTNVKAETPKIEATPTEPIAENPASKTAPAEDQSLLIASVVGGVLMVLLGGFFIYKAIQKPAGEESKEQGPEPTTKNKSATKPVRSAETKNRTSSRVPAPKKPAPADDNPFANLD